MLTSAHHSLLALLEWCVDKYCNDSDLAIALTVTTTNTVRKSISGLHLLFPARGISLSNLDPVLALRHIEVATINHHATPLLERLACQRLARLAAPQLILRHANWHCRHLKFETNGQDHSTTSQHCCKNQTASLVRLRLHAHHRLQNTTYRS